MLPDESLVFKATSESSPARLLPNPVNPPIQHQRSIINNIKKDSLVVHELSRITDCSR